jgi:hypothetical protein
MGWIFGGDAPYYHMHERSAAQSQCTAIRSGTARHGYQRRDLVNRNRQTRHPRQSPRDDGAPADQRSAAPEVRHDHPPVGRRPARPWADGQYDRDLLIGGQGSDTLWRQGYCSDPSLGRIGVRFRGANQNGKHLFVLRVTGFNPERALAIRPLPPVSSGRRGSAISYQASPRRLCTSVDRRYHCLRRMQKRAMS